MKKRIYTIDGKILVQGGTDNELKSNEIRINADKSMTERVNGEIVNVGGSSGSGGGLRPVTADDFSSIVLSNSEDGSMDAIFSDTITLTEQTAINIRLNNKKADLVQPVKEECQLVYTGEERGIYYYRNESNAPTTFNMSQLYIKEG